MVNHLLAGRSRLGEYMAKLCDPRRNLYYGNSSPLNTVVKEEEAVTCKRCLASLGKGKRY